MKKNFFKLSLILNIVLAVLSAVFMFVYSYYDRNYDGDAFFTFLYYVKSFFNLSALFVGYATIIFAFSRLGIRDGIVSLCTFSVSVFISFVTMIIGSCIESASVSVDFFMSMIFYSCGNCFITQILPALLIALLTYRLSKKGTFRITSFISWKNPAQKSMIITTLCLLGFNVIYYSAVILLPNLIAQSFMVYSDQLVDIIVSYVEKIVFYLVMQYLVYYFMYKIYDGYLISHPDKKEKV